MKNETIKTFTEITVEQAAQFQRAGWKDFSVSNEKGQWGRHGLDAISHDGCSNPFYSETSESFFMYCATVTELDPCQAPDGCPELEPWMAYVGLGSDELSVIFPPIDCIYDCERHECHVSWASRKVFHRAHYHYAIDVRTAWAQEHFPEFCRIRNYQEPDAFEEFAKKMNHSYAVAGEELYIIAAAAGGRSLLREAYELGQANPKPTK
jgi:hypothetical protein